jgi:hypothetical protein
MIAQSLYTRPAPATATAKQVEDITSLCARVAAAVPSWAEQCAEYTAIASSMPAMTATVVIDNLFRELRNARRRAA